MSEAPFSHLDEQGRARMVDVGGKEITERRARAELLVRLGPELLERLQRDALPKGDVLAVARVAGIQGAKRCSELVPLCHPLALSKVEVDFELCPPDTLRVVCEARCAGRTGVEMEALTGCSIAGLTIYDMCKAVSKSIRLDGLRLLEKEGGKSGRWSAEPGADA